MRVFDGLPGRMRSTVEVEGRIRESHENKTSHKLPLRMLKKLKPTLLTALTAIVAVYVFNRFIGPRIGLSA